MGRGPEASEPRLVREKEKTACAGSWPQQTFKRRPPAGSASRINGEKPYVCVQHRYHAAQVLETSGSESSFNGNDFFNLEYVWPCFSLWECRHLGHCPLLDKQVRCQSILSGSQVDPGKDFCSKSNCISNSHDIQGWIF